MRIGLTGGVGCGASEAARHLESLGIPVVSGDEIGHRALLKDSVKTVIRQEFGNKVFADDGEIDRKLLGQIVFADDVALETLNTIIHPVMLEILKHEVSEKETENGTVVVDAALIYEWELQDFFDKIILVTAPIEKRIERVMMRSGITRIEVEQRISAQMPVEDKAAMADYVINNDKTVEDLHKKADHIWNLINHI